MKKLIATLSAITMLLCITPLNGVAEGGTLFDAVPRAHRMAKDMDEVRHFYYMDDTGAFSYLASRYDCCFLITTDGTVPSEESLQAIPDFVSCEMVIVGDDSTGIGLEALSYDSTWSEGTVVYRINLSSYDNLLQIAQQYAIEHDWVQDTYLRHYMETSTIYKEGSPALTIKLKESAELPAEGIEGLAGLDLRRPNDRYYDAELNDANKSRLSGNDTFTDEDFAVMIEVANRVMEDYHECVETATFHGHSNFNYILISDLYPVWRNHGDANGDQTINASDAAEVLIAAAMTGAGRSVDT
ncbi:MAG: hypothetical protein K2I93_02625, partial [Oscillospiraceae bacterium]|nr:hypothetical protein [Oscillospiraceae bacterium]